MKSILTTYGMIVGIIFFLSGFYFSLGDVAIRGLLGLGFAYLCWKIRKEDRREK